MRHDVREVVERSVAELDNVVTTFGCGEVADDVLAEVGCELEGVMAAIASEQVVARRARQMVVALRAQDNTPGNRTGLPSAAVRDRRGEAMHDAVGERRRGGDAECPVRAHPDRSD